MGLRGQKRSQEKIEGDFKKEWGNFSVIEAKGIKISRKEWPTEVTGAQRRRRQGSFEKVHLSHWQMQEPSVGVQGANTHPQPRPGEPATTESRPQRLGLCEARKGARSVWKRGQ